MKIVLKTEGQTGDNLKFIESLNAKFAEIEIPDSDALLLAVKKATKGLWDEKGEKMNVDFEKLAAKLTEIEDINIKEMLGEGENGLKMILKRQGEVINQLKELKSSGPAPVKSVKQQLVDYLEKNKSGFDSFRAGESKAFGASKQDDGQMGAGIEIKAAATITSTQAGTTFTPGVEIEPGLTPLYRNKPFIEDYSNSSATNRARIVWTEKYNPQGQAAFTDQGGVKSLISFSWREFESYAKKVTDKIKVSTEALDDIDWMAAEIQTELKYQVDILVDTELLSGSGDGSSGNVHLQGITNTIGGYILTTVLTTTPNNYDALRAAYAQIVSLNFLPTNVFINPIDGANMDLVKDLNGRPLAMEYRDAQGLIMRIMPIETNQMPVGSFLMADMSKFRVRNYKAFAVYFGWVNDDFEKNLVTIIAERRLHSYIKHNEYGAFVYDTFANVKTAITAP